jgi:hypothetical protein
MCQSGDCLGRTGSTASINATKVNRGSQTRQARIANAATSARGARWASTTATPSIAGNAGAAARHTRAGVARADGGAGRTIGPGRTRGFQDVESLAVLPVVLVRTRLATVNTSAVLLTVVEPLCCKLSVPMLTICGDSEVPIVHA